MKNNYKVDYKTQTIIIANDFADRARSNVNSNEYKEMKQLQNDYPTYTFKFRKNIVSQKDSHKDLTFDRMELFIKTFDEQTLPMYVDIKSYFKTATKSCYINVKSWFLNKYPDYRETEMAYEATIKLLDELDKKAKKGINNSDKRNEKKDSQSTTTANTSIDLPTDDYNAEIIDMTEIDNEVSAFVAEAERKAS